MDDANRERRQRWALLQQELEITHAKVELAYYDLCKKFEAALAQTGLTPTFAEFQEVNRLSEIAQQKRDEVDAYVEELLK
jgi:hypothetical protein